MKVTVFVVLLLAVAQTRTEYVTVGPKQFYVERDVKLNWHAAWNYCAVNKMKLFSLETELENRQLWPLISGLKLALWTSGFQPAAERSFIWFNSGRPLTYLNWGNNEPKNPAGTEFCIYTNSSLKWYTVSCKSTANFICEY